MLISQPPELPEKSAPVPSNASVDPAERRSASCSAAGDRQGEPRAAAGEEYQETCVVMGYPRLLYTTNDQATTVMCHRRRFEATKRNSSRC